MKLNTPMWLKNKSIHQKNSYSPWFQSIKILVFVLLGIITSCTFNKEESKVEPLNVPPGYYSVKAKIKILPGLYDKFTIHYPVFNENKLDSLNISILKKLKDEVFLLQYEDLTNCTDDEFVANVYLPIHEITFDIFSNTEDLISVRFNFFKSYEYSSNTTLYFITINYNPITNQFISIENMFDNSISNEKQVALLQSLVSEKAKNTTQYYRFIQHGNYAIGTFNNFTLANDTITFHFGKYSFTGFEQYSMQIQVAKAELSDKIKNSGNL